VKPFSNPCPGMIFNEEAGARFSSRLQNRKDSPFSIESIETETPGLRGPAVGAHAQVEISHRLDQERRSQCISRKLGHRNRRDQRATPA
jgi:hypothetical protein